MAGSNSSSYLHGPLFETGRAVQVDSLQGDDYSTRSNCFHFVHEHSVLGCWITRVGRTARRQKNNIDIQIDSDGTGQTVYRAVIDFSW